MDVKSLHFLRNAGLFGPWLIRTIFSADSDFCLGLGYSDFCLHLCHRAKEIKVSVKAIKKW